MKKLREYFTALKSKPRKNKKGSKKLIIILLIIIVIAAVVIKIKKDRDAAAAMAETSFVNTAMVRRGNISNELTSSGNLEPKDTYTITSLVTGEIISADFEEGDHVEKDQVLYVIDKSDMSTNVDQAERSLETAQRNLTTAQSDYNKAISSLGGGTVKSTQSGYVKNITIKDGDTVNGGTVNIADLYNDSAMTVRLAFINTDADALEVGQDIIVELGDTGETLPGVVLEKSDLVETINSGTLVKNVEILVTNPGGLTENDRAMAYMGDIVSVTDNTFKPYVSGNLSVEMPSQVKINSVLVKEGQYVTSGTPLFTIESNSLRDAINSAEDSLRNAENNLKEAENGVVSINEQVDRYTITAPIEGQIITKNYKTGDNISNGSNGSSELALIYDLSQLTFNMSIDELDISDVEVGQKVVVTADAVEGKSFTGYVSNVSLKSTTTNGVTTYPVVVTLDETDGLLPGMNVDGVIILDEAEDVLYIPSNALMRGNIVYVKNESLTGDEPAGNALEDAQVAEGEPAADVPEDLEGAGDAGQDSQELSQAAMNDAPEGFTAVKVETGLISNDNVEILSGLSEGQEVYVRESTESFGFGFDYEMVRGGGPGGPRG